MNRSRVWMRLFLCLICVFLLSGCASLLAIPAEVIGGTFKLLGKLIDLAARMPKPPPGVF